MGRKIVWNEWHLLNSWVSGVHCAVCIHVDCGVYVESAIDGVFLNRPSAKNQESSVYIQNDNTCENIIISN